MITIAICDDQQDEIAYLTALTQDWAAQRSQPVRLSGYTNAQRFLWAHDAEQAADILLLDIQMDGLDGISLAKTIRKTNQEIQIILITGYMDYIADGYDVEALRYLLKPVNRETLFPVLDRAVEKLARNERVLVIHHAGVHTRIPLHEIRYLEVWKNYVTIHAKQEHKLKKPLAALEQALDDRFFRTGRSYLVNLWYIRKTTKTQVFLSDDTVIPLPAGMYEALNRALIMRL